VKKFPQYLVAVLAAVCLVMGAAACSDPKDAPTSTASCAFIVGNGRSGNDADIHKIVYPGDLVQLEKGGDDEADEDAWYVPCNSRNYIINDGTVRNANDDRVGDRFTPVTGYVGSGVQVKAWVTAEWTLNQSDAAMRNFWSTCHKYNCASAEDKGGNANFSTPGWNGMLGEVFGPSLDRAAALAFVQVTDDIWQKHDPREYDKVASAMAESFADIVRAKTGYTQDLFCGSGNSGWKDPTKPGEGEFTCTNVRITIDRVERAKVKADDETSAGVAEINRQRLENAKVLYGDNAAYWLAVMDAIEACKETQSTCVFNIGDPPALPAGTDVSGSNP
jgi:hypothetical protein